MFDSTPSHDEVDQLLLNAQLRNELEPFLDESVDLVNVNRMTTSRENEFLASMLAWERAPILPISDWFDPPLCLPLPDRLSDDDVADLLQKTIEQLYSARIVLELTAHLSDRQLLTLIIRDILPSPEKKVDLPKNYLHWHCLDVEQDPETWLSYYASDEERHVWAMENLEEPPARLEPPYPRTMPRRPL